MSSTPLVPSFRMPWQAQISTLPPQHQEVLTSAFNALTDLYTANQVNASEISKLKAGTTTAAASTTTNVTTASETTIVTQNTIGMVNSQIGNVAYTTQQSDYGAFLLFADASAVAVNLASAPGIQTPYMFFAINFGPSTVTFTPAAGTISYGTTSAAGSMPLIAGYFAIISYDGTSFWAAALPLVPSTFAPVANEFLTGYNAATGAFTGAQPTISNVLGLAASLALLAPIASPTFTGTVTQPTPSVLTAATTATSATAGAATALPATPLGYLEMTVNSVVVKVPYFSV